MTGTDRETALWDNLREAEDVLASDEMSATHDRYVRLSDEEEKLEDALEAVRRNLKTESAAISSAHADVEMARQAIKDFYITGGGEPAEDVHAAVEAMARELGGGEPPAFDKVSEKDALADEENEARIAALKAFSSTASDPRDDGPSDWVLNAKDALAKASKAPTGLSFALPDGVALCAGEGALVFEPLGDDDELPAFADLSPAEQAAVVDVLDDDEPFVGVADALADAPKTRLVIGRASDVTDEMLAEARIRDAREAASTAAE